MEYLIICLASLVTSALTLFSGFGLGTLLLPAFALFFSVDVAVGLTAIVHFLNNLFKLSFFGKNANWGIVLRFGLPAILAALLGAGALYWLANLAPITSYGLWGRELHVMPVKFVVSLLMIVFALFELVPSFEKIAFDKRYLPIGGLLSGFFGGLSGHQGALRSAFLLKSGLSKESFIGTGVVIACLVDFTRLSVYSTHFSRSEIKGNALLLLIAVSSAFLGVFLGSRMVKKVTMRSIQVIVAFMLIGIALVLGSGLI